jgi:hypothetical protein
VLRVTGFDSLPGDVETIDGRTLRRTEFIYTKRDKDGTVTDDFSGHQYLDEELRVIWPGFFNDKVDPERSSDMSPVDFIYPGEDNFLTSRPIYDCNSELIRYVPSAQEEARQ